MKISDYYTYAPKSKIKAGDANPNGKYQFYTSSPDESRRCDEYLYDCKAIVMGTGGSATLHYYDGKFSTSTDCLTLIPNEKIRAKYLYYFFLANMDVLEAGFKGAGLKHTSKGYIDNIEITKIPSLPSQDKIVNLFDELALRIEKERRQIEKLDELVKARFVEMFGGEQCAILQDLSDRITDGSHLPPKGVEKSDYLMLSSQNIFDEINRDGARFLSKEDFENENRRTDIKDGDVLVTIVGTIGRTHIVRSGEKYVFQRSVGVIKPKSGRLNGVYLASYLQTCRAKAFLTSRAHGSSQKGIYLQDLKKLPVPLVPMALQNQFAAFVAQVDKSKFVLSNELTMCDFHIRLIHDRVMHSCINLRVAQ